jgi:stage II sporulation protein AA (anti-sigma F factor antagonist)
LLLFSLQKANRHRNTTTFSPSLFYNKDIDHFKERTSFMQDICTITDSPSLLTVSLCGELDHHAAKELCRKIDDALYHTCARQIVLDLREIRFMDSAGLGLIFGRYRRICELGATLILRDPNPQVEKILRLAGVERIIPVQYTKALATAD